MNLDDFAFDLDLELIAKIPLENRDASRLLILNQGSIIDKNFSDCVDFLEKDDLIILNDTKVIKSRLILDSKIDLYLHKKITELKWICFAKPSKKISVGDKFKFHNGILNIVEKLISGEVVVEFDVTTNVYEFLEIHGQMPVPPYFKRKNPLEYDDNQRYQTVYAKNDGSVAAPTAGLHFTDQIFDKIKSKGVKLDYVTLHVGAGTFLPIKTQNINEHLMHEETCFVSDKIKQDILDTKRNGNKVISVGTTTLRALESAFLYEKSGYFNTDIFIKPKFDFLSTDILITNFHLPKSTLIILVSAFGGYKNIMKAYTHATKNKYRFFSYGDAMMIYRNSTNKL